MASAGCLKYNIHSAVLYVVLLLQIEGLFQRFLLPLTEEPLVVNINIIEGLMQIGIHLRSLLVAYLS